MTLSPTEAQHILHSRPWTPETESGSEGSSPKRKKSDRGVKAAENLAAARSAAARSSRPSSFHQGSTPSSAPRSPVQTQQMIQLPPLRTYLESHSLDVDLAAQSHLPPPPPPYSGQALPFRHYDTPPRSRQSSNLSSRILPPASTSPIPSTAYIPAERQSNNLAAFRHGDTHAPHTTDGNTGSTPSALHSTTSQPARNFTWHEPLYTSANSPASHVHPSQQPLPGQPLSSSATSSSHHHPPHPSTPYFHVTTPSSNPSNPLTTTPLSTLHPEIRTPKPRHNLPPAARATLKEWFAAHVAYPYPSEEEKMRLVASTGLEGRQVENWFINARRRWKGRKGEGSAA